MHYTFLGNDRQVKMELARLAHCDPLFRHNGRDEFCGRNVERWVVD
jgi:hypothetical protein